MEIDVAEFVKTKKPRKPVKKDMGRSVYLISGGVVLIVVLVILGVLAGVRTIANWGAEHEIVGQRVLSVSIQWPFRIEDRKPQVLAPIEKQVNMPELKTDIEKYICDKFGVMDCKIALSIAKAESNLNCNAFNINTNGSVDLGIFQLNSVHLKKGGEWTLANMSDCEKNVDLAYQLWTEQGWHVWSAFLNGSYLAKL